MHNDDRIAAINIGIVVAVFLLIVILLVIVANFFA